MNYQRLLLAFFFTCVAVNVYAVCPVCTIAVGAGIGFTSWLGIDDLITGLWIGALTVSLIVWTVRCLDRKNVHFLGRKILVVSFYYLSTILPLYFQGYIGHMLNKLWGIDKLLLGIMVGSVVFFAGSLTYDILKRNHGGKPYFPFQKVVMPIFPLIILSLAFYYVSK